MQAGLFRAENEDKALAQATMAVLQGLELGIPPMQAVEQIAIIGGRCTIWGDLIPALIWRAGHKIREWIEGEGDGCVAWCEITRGDNKEVITRKFSVDDAKRAGLWDTRAKIKQKDKPNIWHEEDNSSPWYRFQERMLQMRARGASAPATAFPMSCTASLSVKKSKTRRNTASRNHKTPRPRWTPPNSCLPLRRKKSAKPQPRPSETRKKTLLEIPKLEIPKSSFQTSMSAWPPPERTISSMRSGPKTSNDL